MLHYGTMGHTKTQYLHMNKRKVRKGQKVQQGDIIGTVGMTGYTSGPHVLQVLEKRQTGGPFSAEAPRSQTH